MVTVQSEDINSEEITGMCEELDISLENTMEVMNRLYTKYKMDMDNRSTDLLKVLGG